MVYTKTQEEHDIRLEALLKQIQKSGVTLNPEKCEFSKSTIGHVVDKHGVHPDPQKTDAISNMKPPKNLTELRRFLGIVLEYPWQEVGTDLFTFKNSIYLVVVDYFLRYPEIACLTSTTSH